MPRQVRDDRMVDVFLMARAQLSEPDRPCGRSGASEAAFWFLRRMELLDPIQSRLWKRSSAEISRWPIA